MKKYLINGLLLVVVILLAVITVQPIITGAQVQAKEFKFGVNTPLSGPAAPWGVYNTRGMTGTG